VSCNFRARALKELDCNFLHASRAKITNFHILSTVFTHRDSLKANEDVGKEVLAELRERAQQPEADKVNTTFRIRIVN